MLWISFVLLAFAARACEHSEGEQSNFSDVDEEVLKDSPFASRLSPLEELFVVQPSHVSARTSLKFLTSTPHMAGTKQDKLLAFWMVDQFKSRLGVSSENAWVDPVPAKVSYPKHRPKLALVSNDSDQRILFEAKLSEDLLDSTSNTWFRNHTLLGYSPSGNVTGYLVYANFGTPDDFRVLENAGVAIQGRIVIVRYGKCFRGLKVRNAQVRGAIGVLIYSDPMEDGFTVGKTYTEGPWRPKSSVQRGSVQFNSLCSGDPYRLNSKENFTFEQCGYEPHELVPKIPVLPLAWEDALPFLKTLKGPSSPRMFKGALYGVSYRLGPSEVPVRLQVSNTLETRNIWNAFALVRGQHYGTLKDRPIILGNHRDAWVFGAVDPNSGTSCMLEMAKGFGILLQTGWKPKRSILFASWSGEELGLLGSTAFGEEDKLGFLKRVIAYVNVDIGVSGDTFQLGATGTLARLVRQVLSDLPDPIVPQRSLLHRWPNHQSYSQLGTGSDFTVFIHHLGIPSLDMRFAPVLSSGGKATAYGVYHSDFDSFDWMERFGDPGFVFHVAMARIWGVVALRLADSHRLPFHPLDQAKSIAKFVQLVKPMVSDPLAFQAMEEAAEEYITVAKGVEKEVHFDNDRLAFAERKFLLPRNTGLPLRKWYRHVLQAPNIFLGYDADFIPGVQQAYRDMNDSALANTQARLFAACVKNVAHSLFHPSSSLQNDIPVAEM